MEKYDEGFRSIEILPTQDIVFKLMLGNPQHTRALIHLLNCMQVSLDPVVSIDILNSEITPENVALKGFRLDIKARTDKDEIVLIEMQCSEDPAMVARVLEYWSDSFSSQLRSGEYYDELKRTVSITVSNFKIFKQDGRFWRKFHIADTEANEKMTDLFEMAFFELQKMGEVDENNPLTCWAEFLKRPYSDETKNICEKISEIKEARDMYEKAKADPKTFEMIKARERAQYEYQARLAYAGQ